MAMNKPSLDELMQNVDSRYTLVVAAAKRARILTEKAEANPDLLTEKEASVKPVTLALQEMVQDKISYRRTRQGIK